ncbi:ring-opening amidohydrolase [Gordonia hongkongensis]|uniref:Cyanuric acid amidohydrolase n=1 Tax=Gordonia hongkongensis TaxID=1701090 RepID=A0ABT6BTQ5_9ACTN|nr:ring-opening amidohydrolase [Gordonia hongkongensis]MDF6101432.1 ring-opening amidohydrolase [Gordonia hongkongensis]
MTGVRLLTVPTTGPDDTDALKVLSENGSAPGDILAVIGKTEGNGCVNDFSRTLAAASWGPRLDAEAITVFSGGTEGVLAPHVNLLVADDSHDEGHDRGLVAAVGTTPVIPPDDLGRGGQLEAVRDTVAKLLVDLDVALEDVHLVLVKCPLLTSADIAEMRSRGVEPVTDDTYESMARSRAASSLGIASALGEIDDETARAALAGRRDAWSNRASASSGAELDSCHILVLAESSGASNPLRALHTEMSDAYDLAALQDAAAVIAERGGRIRQLFLKAESDPSGTIRGLRHTMLTDSDINATRHARAAVGALAAAVKGDGAVYVSGGAEHQGRPGGGSVTVVYEVDPQHLATSTGGTAR